MAADPFRRDVVTPVLVVLYLAGVAWVAWTGQSRTHLLEFWAGSALMAACAAGLFARGTLSLRGVLVLALAARVAVLGWMPALSDDAFRYLWDGLVQHAGLNPYAFRPDELEAWHGHALFGRLNSAGFHSVYPPLSQILFWLATAWNPADWVVGWYVWKGMCLAAEAATMVLLSRVGGRYVLLYALHPLPIVELVGQAHTEAFMVLGLAVAGWGWHRGRPGVAAWGIVAAALVKLYPVLLLPLAFRTRADWKRAVPALTAGIVLVAPYWGVSEGAHVLASLRLYTQYFEFNAGLYHALKWIAGALGYGDVSKTLGPVLAGVFAVACLAVVVVAHRRQVPFARAAGWMLGAYLVLSTTVHPWYLSGVLVLLALARTPGWAWQWLALCALGTYLRYVGGPYAAVVAVGWGGAALVAAFILWHACRSSTSSPPEPARKPAA